VVEKAEKAIRQVGGSEIRELPQGVAQQKFLESSAEVGLLTSGRANHCSADLHTAARESADRPELTRLLEGIIRKAGALVNTGDGYIYLVNPDEEEIEVRVAVGFHRSCLGRRLKRGEGLSGKVWQKGEPLLVDDYSGWGGRARGLNFKKLNSIMGIPLRFGSNVIGVIGFSYRDDARKFRTSEIGILGHFADMASLAVRNERLYSALQEERALSLQTEKELQKQTIRNELVFLNAIDCFCIFDMEGTILEANPAMSCLLGFSLKELIGMKLCELEVVETPDETAKHVQKLIQKGSDRFEVRHRRKDGAIVDLEVSANYVEMGGERLFFSFYHDITERKRAERELAEREAELETKALNLEEVNTTLKVLLKGRDEDRRKVEEKILFNVKEMVGPYLDKLRQSGLDSRQKAYLEILESNLNEITLPFSKKLPSWYLKLSPTETRIADLIRHGKTTKEIAGLLNLSSQTISFHRRNIRKKLGINKLNTSLRAYFLSSFDG
jgi:PAS domain S-box-containing protein